MPREEQPSIVLARLLPMLEQLGQQLSKAFLAVVVVVLSLAFIISSPFGNQDGCRPSGPTYAAKVYGETITPGDFEAAMALAAYAMSGGRSTQLPREMAERYELRRHVLDGLIERSLLARRAREVGFDVDQEDIWRHLADDGSAMLSMGIEAPPQMASTELRLSLRDEDGAFDREGTESLIQFGLRRSLAEFAENQIEERLASRMRETVTASARVGPEEVWNAYVQEKELAVISFVRFFPRYFQDRLDPDDASVRAWLEANEETVRQGYESRQRQYTDLEKQVRARHILVRLEEGSSDEAREAALEKARTLQGRVRRGESFSTLARRYSDDAASARKGGDLGWNARGAMVPPFDEAQFAMAVGDVSDLVESRFGYHIIKVDGIREGTVPEAEAMLEIAEEKYRESRGEELAREAATRALTMLGEGTDTDSIAKALENYPEIRDPEAADDDDPLLVDRERDPFAPTAERSRRFGRGGVPIDGVDNSSLIRTVFDQLSLDDPRPETVLELGGDFFAYQLEERETADRDSFTDAVQQRLTEGLGRQKRSEVLTLFIARLRKDAEEASAVTVNQAMLSYDGEELPAPEEEPTEG